MTQQASRDLFISSLTIAEIHRGILAPPRGKKRSVLEDWFSGPGGPQLLFAQRVLPFDVEATLIWARIWARLMAEAKLEGRPRNELDTIIAAVAVSNDCVVVTDNERDFFGLSTIDPMRDPDTKAIGN